MERLNYNISYIIPYELKMFQPTVEAFNTAISNRDSHGKLKSVRQIRNDMFLFSSKDEEKTFLFLEQEWENEWELFGLALQVKPIEEQSLPISNDYDPFFQRLDDYLWGFDNHSPAITHVIDVLDDELPF